MWRRAAAECRASRRPPWKRRPGRSHPGQCGLRPDVTLAPHCRKWAATSLLSAEPPAQAQARADLRGPMVAIAFTIEWEPLRASLRLSLGSRWRMSAAARWTRDRLVPRYPEPAETRASRGRPSAALLNRDPARRPGSNRWVMAGRRHAASLARGGCRHDAESRVVPRGTVA